MNAYTDEDFRIDQFRLIALEQRHEPRPMGVSDARGHQYPADRFATTAEYNYFYGETLIAYYHRCLTTVDQLEHVLKRELVYLEKNVTGLTRVPLTSGAGLIARGRVHVAPMLETRAELVGLQTQLQRKLAVVRQQEQTLQTALMAQIGQMQRLLCALYDQGVDPADYLALNEREPQSNPVYW